jgi:secreted Zn-dependent insulinase-like peptidase
LSTCNISNLTTVGWAMNLMAGECSDSNEYSFFSVSMRLTDAGHGQF